MECPVGCEPVEPWWRLAGVDALCLLGKGVSKCCSQRQRSWCNDIPPRFAFTVQMREIHGSFAAGADSSPLHTMCQCKVRHGLRHRYLIDSAVQKMVHQN